MAVDFEEKNIIGCLKTNINYILFLCFKRKKQVIGEFF